MSSKLNIRIFDQKESQQVISIWQECNLTRPWNNPQLDIDRKVSFQNDLFLIGELNNKIIATAMFGYDGHRGWLNYFAVLPSFQRNGYGRQLLEYGENKLIELGCPKLNMQIRNDNEDVINFYKDSEYTQDCVVSFGKRFVQD